MLVIVGSVIVIASVLGGFVMVGGHLGVLIQVSEFVVIGGAALGSLIISTPMPVLKAMVGGITGFFAAPRTKGDFLELLSMLYLIFKQSQQQGIMSLESHFDKPTESSILSQFPKFLSNHHALDFLSDSVKVIIIGGIAPHDLESLMDEDAHVVHEEELKAPAALNKLGDALPGLGIVAAVLGIVHTMAAIDQPPSVIGHMVAAALVGTFLGILMSYGFLGPMATQMEHRINGEGAYTTCIKAGLLAVYKGFPPAIAIEFARRVLPIEVRPSFDETEQACKAAGKPAAAAA
ncbi:MAG: flagellar motor stator protein MotA [Vicinamibacterales bacterium]